MTTYYVSKTGLDVNTGLSGSGAKLTILAAIQAADTSGDTVEIIDEGSYNEGNLGMSVANLTITHTASHLGRPTIYGTGLGGSEPNRAFYPDVNAIGATYVGLEISHYTDQVFQGAAAGYHKFTMSGCFVHDVPRLGSVNFTNTDSANPIVIKQCTLFFENAGSEAIRNDGYMEISNCLITSSNSTSSPDAIIRDYSNNGTASFSTIIQRGAFTVDNPIVRFAKVINCIVTGSGRGIASDDQTYNIVSVSDAAYMDFSNSISLGAGTGEQTATYDEIAFVDGASVGGRTDDIESYNLQDGSVAVEAGTAYDGIVVDITGTVRPYCGGEPDVGCFEFQRIWTGYTDEEEFPFSTDFTNNHYANLNADHKFRACYNPKQVPFSRGVKGPATLRGRNTPYKAE